jgi:L-malate glycosyltransferase
MPRPEKISRLYIPQDLDRTSRVATPASAISAMYRKDVENVYHTADIVVVPSRWQEPLGLINLEAGACRKPVVATRVGGIPEVVVDGVNGYLVEPATLSHWPQRVAALIADPSLRARLGEAGRARVEQDFTTRPVKEFEALLLSYIHR